MQNSVEMFDRLYETMKARRTTHDSRTVLMQA